MYLEGKDHRKEKEWESKTKRSVKVRRCLKMGTRHGEDLSIKLGTKNDNSSILLTFLGTHQRKGLETCR